ncbi:hypothetical protein ASD11_14925 [Aeromicrobium sp. Root495]|nr:hypothetical protein ASD11_14925 [Aeromicrobium sp. Root495]
MEVGGLQRGHISIRKNAPFTIAVALVVGVTNMAVLDRWRETLDANGDAPWEAHVETRKIRDNIRHQRAA